MLSKNLTKLGYLGRTNTQRNTVPFYDEGTPSLDLNFARNKSLIDSVSGKNLIDFTRNSIGTYVGEDGLIKTAGVNEPRFDHDPVTGESLGLLVEERRENVIRNNTMVGASALAPSTMPTSWGISTNNAELSQFVVGIGVESGISYIDIKISGTVTASRDCDILMQSPFIPASNGQTWTHSVYLRQVGGSQTNISDIRIQGNVYSDLAYITTPWFQSVQVTTENLITQRRVATATLVGETITRVAPFIKVTTASSGVVDFTLRIGMPQVELGPFATSIIPTSGSTIIRNADNASISGANFSDWYDPIEGTTLIENRNYNVANVSTSLLSYVGTSSPNNSMNYFRQLDSQPVGQIIFNGSLGMNIGLGPVWTNTNLQKHAFFYKKDNSGIADKNLVSNDNIVDVPNVDRMIIGNSSNNQTNNKFTLSRLTYWPARLPNSTLQNITK